MTPTTTSSRRRTCPCSPRCAKSGFPESVIDVVEPFFRVLVELGYDRSIDPWEPTPARLIPTNLDPAEVVTDLVNAIGEGATNAAALFGAPAPSSSSTDADDAVLASVSPGPGTAIASISARSARQSHKRIQRSPPNSPRQTQRTYRIRFRCSRIRSNRHQ